MEQEKLSFEAAMQRLDGIVKRLERGDVALEESLSLLRRAPDCWRPAIKCSTPRSRRSLC